MTLSTLVTRREIMAYLISFIFVLLFGQIYEIFSHNVYSNFMMFACIIPVIGLIITSIIYLSRIKSSSKGRLFIGLSLITLTIWMIINGVLEIYGTTNKLVNIYPIITIILILIALISFIGNEVK